MKKLSAGILCLMITILLLQYFFDIMRYIIAKSMPISGNFILSYSFALAVILFVTYSSFWGGCGCFYWLIKECLYPKKGGVV